MTPFELIGKVRKAMGVNQGDLAAAAGITQQAISEFEKGKSTLSIEALTAMAPLLKMDPMFFAGEAANPFASASLIKMIIPTVRTSIPIPVGIQLSLDFVLLSFLVEINTRLSFFLLSLRSPIVDRITRKTVFETPIYAVVAKDSDGNLFLFRRKENSVHRAAIIGLGEFETDANEVARKEGKLLSFHKTKTDRMLYRRIMNWTVESDDLQATINVPLETKLGQDEANQELLTTMQKHCIEPKEAVKLFDTIGDLEINVTEAIEIIKKNVIPRSP